MVNVNTAFPSKYIAAADLKGRQIVCVIDRVAIETIGEHDRKPVMYFQGGGKGMVLNKTNAQTIAYIHGEETDNWSGKSVELFVQMVNNPQGQLVPGIRCRAVTTAIPGAVPNQEGADRISAPLGTPVQQTDAAYIDEEDPGLPPGF